MYSLLSKISGVLSQPFFNIANSLESWPIVFALILGLVGALAPCQLTGNISAVTLYGNRSIQRKIAWRDVLSFTLGKIVAFSLLGALVWLLGREIEQNLTFYFPWLRKIMGPLLIVVGLFMLGFIKLKGTFHLFKGSKEYKHENPFGSFMLGLSFSLAFCPTMFILFFVTLMPVVLASPYGICSPIHICNWNSDSSPNLYLNHLVPRWQWSYHEEREKVWYGDSMDCRRGNAAIRYF
ncbi:cytochrome c-type biogenesis protein [Bacillus sp. SLBN-46]|nr:cytochrome c-type biogenesis protein [Bacillus sp. SLBN-46]